MAADDADGRGFAQIRRKLFGVKFGAHVIVGDEVEIGSLTDRGGDVGEVVVREAIEHVF